MDEQKRPRAWVYARIPGDYDGTMNSYKVCSMQALHDGCDIVGGSIDERGGWLLRPGYRDMLRQIKAGKVDRVYICRMRQVSGKERHLYSFFKRLMQHGVQVTAMEYSLRDRVNMFRLARRVERYATRKGLQLPWGFSEGGVLCLWHSTSKHGNVISHRPLVRGIPLKPLHRMVNYESKNL